MWNQWNMKQDLIWILMVVALISLVLTFLQHIFFPKKRVFVRRFLQSFLVFCLFGSFLYFEGGQKVKTVEKTMDVLLPSFQGENVVEMNGNLPFFSEQDLKQEAFEYYAPLDGLGRVQKAYARIGLETLPSTKRESIGMVKPSGWRISKYDFIQNKFLYHRCHLIAFELTGKNAMVENLMTGTQQLNVEMMLPYENKIADYVRRTGNHVLYRVTPYFEGNQLVAKAVLLEARSIEDGGKGILFCVFCFNRQDGVEIEYETGRNWAS